MNPDVFITLIHELAKKFYKTSLVKKHKGYILLAEDGTTLNLIKTKEFINRFGFAQNQRVKNYDTAYKATSRSAALYDVTNGLIIDFTMKKYVDSEIPIAIEQLKHISYLNGNKAIYLADRYYNSVELFSILEDKGLKYLVRGKSNFFKKYKMNMESDDEWIIVEIDKAWYKRLKYEQPRLRFKENPYIRIRVVKQKYVYFCKNHKCEEEIIYFTNLEKDEFSKNEIIELYAKRWQIETSYKTLKSDLEWERYFSNDCDSETCSIYAKVLFHNINGIIRKEIDEKISKANSSNNKYSYVTNIKQLINVLRSRNILRWIRNDNRRNINELLEYLTKIKDKIKVPVRPNRHYKRWGRVLMTGHPTRFRVDGRNWPNTALINGRIQTISPK